MEHPDELKRNDFCNFEKPCNHISHMGKIESNKKARGRPAKMSLWKRVEFQTELKVSVVTRIVREVDLGLLNPLEMD